MKTDVPRKRGCNKHHRRAATSFSDTASTSPGESRRASPVAERSPTLAPDSTTRITYENDELRGLQNAFIMGTASGAGDAPFGGLFSSFPFPGPYNLDYLEQHTNASEALPFSGKPGSDHDTKVRSPKRHRHEEEGEDDVDSLKKRRLSFDGSSTSEPPSSAISFSSLDGYTSSATSMSARSSMEFPFSQKPMSVLRGTGGNTFLHPPMIVQDSSDSVHPPMLMPTVGDTGFMDYHPPMLPPEEELFSAFTNDNHGIGSVF